MDALLIVARTLHFAATAALEGVFVFWCFVGLPSFRRAQAASALEAQLDRRLLEIAWTSLAIGLATGVVWLFIVASQMSGTPLAGVLSQGVLGIVLTSTQFGQDWRLRVVLGVAVAISLAVQGRTWKYGWRWIGLITSATLVASLAWAGHGAAAEDVPFDVLHLPADILHLVASGAWLGALLPLVLLFVAARRDGGPAALDVARVATLRFSALGITCVSTLTVTGVVNTWFLAGTIPALVGTLYGQLLLVKVLFFAGMVAIASVNRRRLTPYLEQIAVDVAGRLRALQLLGRNAFLEVGLGVLVLAIVGIIGVLPPGLHTEPNWPFGLRIDFNEIVAGAQTAFYVVAVLFVLCLAALAIAADRRRTRGMAASVIGLVVLGIIGWVAVRPGIVTAYPTSYYAPTQPYAAPSISRGATLYTANCIACHGVDGRGDGPLASKLPVRPADLTEEHLFAHSVGDIYWWVSNGLDNGVMPGFASKLTPDERWDVINFVRARASGVLARASGSQVTTAAAPSLPDFAFEQRGAQNTLNEALKTGPALIVLFASPPPQARFAQLAAAQARLASAGLQILAVDLSSPPVKGAAPASFVVNVSDDVRAMLALFRLRTDGGETELMLDRGGSVRARWTANKGGVADLNTLISDAVRVKSIPVGAANHAGHAH